MSARSKTAVAVKVPSDAEVIARLVAAAPPLTTEQRAILAAQWRRDQQPRVCRPDPTSPRTS
ncbi:hypothetical protein Val02_81730 [Virgisporangium aliadipatigenens]|uniref:Uncharacterized protein n=1 Tax=Virgisporangium aliadipatigenens TaxID=741659 RepID=A0A8J3YV81_9ACTN|nr:hypothetical protein [Virgisporangium aliadipatigenens]GIJ51287.1 hypothetical protein Val02_81730 [Virgisporangium aliadipatigenens]